MNRILKHINDTNQVIKLTSELSPEEQSKLFHEVVKRQHYKLVSILVSKFGINPNVTINESLTSPLFYAVKLEDVKLVNLLLSLGADVLHLNKWHETPLSLSVNNINSDKSNTDISMDKSNNLKKLLLRYRPVTSLQTGFNNPKAHFIQKENEITIRCIQPGDIDEIKNVYLKSYSEYSSNYKSIQEYLTKIYTQDMKNPYEFYGLGVRPNTAFWVAENNSNLNSSESKIVGTIALVPTPQNVKVGEIQRFSIDPKYQRLGLGQKLMEHVENWAIQREFESLFLRTLPELTKAIEFYKKNGFELINSSKLASLDKAITLDFQKNLRQMNLPESSKIPKTEFYDTRKEVLGNTDLKFYEVSPEKGKIYITHDYIKNGNYNQIFKQLMKTPLPFPFKRDFTTYPVLQDYFLELCKLNTKNYVKESWKLDYYIEEKPGTLARVLINGSPKIEKLELENLVSPLIIPFDREFDKFGNVLVDYFNEGARVECIYDKEGKSTLELYQNPEIKSQIINKALRKYKEISDFSLRHSVYGIISGCNLFKPQLAKAIYDLFEPEKVLDMCSGWGDRMIGAMACSTIREYQGFDPNTKLIPGYKNIISHFEGVVKGNYNIESIPFENSTLKNEYYDLAFTSPPFFDVEVYSSEKTQSIDSIGVNPESDSTPLSEPVKLALWVDTWLYPMMNKAWNALRKGGHLALYINDSKEKLGTSTESGGSKTASKALCQRMMELATNLPSNIFVGIVGVESQTKGKHRLLWTWRKE